MAPALALRSNVVWGLTGNVIFAVTQWGVLAVVARFGTPEDVGIVTLVTALVTPIFFSAGMAMNDAHMVDDLTESTRNDYFALRLVMSALAMLIASTAVVTWYGERGFMIQASAFAFMLVKFIDSQSLLNYGIFQREQRLDFVAIAKSGRGILGLASFAAVYVATGELWFAFLVEAAFWAMAVWLLDHRYLAVLEVRGRFAGILHSQPRILWKLFVRMLPLALSALLVHATVSAPRLVLGGFSDLAVIGLFGAVAYIDTALAPVTNAIGFASAAHLRRAVREGKHRYFRILSAKLVGLSSLIGLTLVASVLAAGGPILRLLYGEAYVDVPLFLVVIFAAALRMATAPLQIALTAGHAFWARFGVNAASFATTLAAALLLVPEFAARGAAWALLLGSVTRAILLVILFLRLPAAHGRFGTAISGAPGP